MATNWPTSRDTFTNPSSSSTLDSPSHAAQHANINDAVEAMQLYAGLVLVKSQTIGSGVSSVTVTDAFSSTFDNYRIIIGIESISGGGVEIGLVLGSTTTGYYHSQISVQFGGTVGGAGQTNDSEFRIGAARSTIGSAISLELNAPYLARETFMMSQSMYPYADATGGLRNFAGVLNNSTSYTAFTVSASTGTITGGAIRVYGYNNG